MDPISGINELLKLLGARSRGLERELVKDPENKTENQKRTKSTEKNDTAAIIEKIRYQIKSLDFQDQTLEKKTEIFLFAVISWKFGELADGFDARKACIQIKELIFSDPQLTSKMEALLKQF